MTIFIKLLVFINVCALLLFSLIMAWWSDPHSSSFCSGGSIHSSILVRRLVHTLSIDVQIGHINSTHSHKRGVHAISLVTFFNLGATSSYAFAICGCEWRIRYRELAHVVMIVTRHRAQLQPTNHAWSATALRANIVARRAALPVLVLQVAEVAREHVGARARCHYIDNQKSKWEFKHGAYYYTYWLQLCGWGVYGFAVRLQQPRVGSLAWWIWHCLCSWSCWQCSCLPESLHRLGCRLRGPVVL